MGEGWGICKGCDGELSTILAPRNGGLSCCNLHNPLQFPTKPQVCKVGRTIDRRIRQVLDQLTDPCVRPRSNAFFSNRIPLMVSLAARFNACCLPGLIRLGKWLLPTHFLPPHVELLHKHFLPRVGVA